MVRPRCIVSYCKNQGRHKFPKDEARRNLWIQAIKHVKPNSTIGTYSGVCSDHFCLSDFSVIPSYWNNYHPARILKKSAVPSVFDWDKTAEDEQQSSSVEDTLSFDSDLLVVEVEEPLSPVQDTVSFNPDQVKATYSRGQTLKSMKPEAFPPLKTNKAQPQNNKQIQKSESTFTIQNAKNTSYYARLKPKKRPAHVDYVKIEADGSFLPPATINGEKRLKITTQPLNNSNIGGKMSIFVPKTDILPQNEDKIKVTTPCLPLNEGKIQDKRFISLCLPQNKGKIQDNTCLPPKVTIKTEQEIETISTDEILTSKDESISRFTCLSPKSTIKIESDVETSDKTQDGDRLIPCIPEVNVKTEPDEEKCTMVEVEIDMPHIKQEMNEADINL